MKLTELIQTFELKLISPLQEDVVIEGVKPLEKAGPSDLSFLANPKYRDQAATTRAAAILVKEPISGCHAIQLECSHPYLMLAKVMAHLFPEPKPEPGVHPTAVIGKNVVLGENCAIGPFCVIGEGVQIGENTELVQHVSVAAGCSIGNACKLFPHVVLYAGTRLGARVRIHANSVLGSDGFGYAQAQGVHVKVPQIGGVIIGDDVEIGSNVSIDRGALDDTVIGKGVKIDNLVQIAHGVRIGDHGMIISQSGISGSTTLGKHTILAGQVGVVGHVEIGDNILIMGDSVVTKSLKTPGRYAGNPAIPFMSYQRQQAHIRNLSDVIKRIKQLEKTHDGDSQ